MRSSIALFKLALSTLPLLALTGCVANKVYRQAMPIVEIPVTPSMPSASSQLPPSSPCPSAPHTGAAAAPAAARTRMMPYNKEAQAAGLIPGRPCLAFIEFDDFGEPWVKDAHGRPTQIDDALALVRQAIHDDPQAVILTFVHGWKHNANPGPPPEEDTNVQGFEETLNYLYTDFYGPKPATADHPAYEGHVVLGIYIAWRGDSISHFWAVQRLFSVYNRESAAMRVGGAPLADTLMRISHLAHPPGSQTGPGTHQPFLIFVGHSFGALVLERAITPAYIQEIEAHQQDSSLQSLPTVADLVLYINSAAAASEAKPMLDYLADKGIEYRTHDDLTDPKRSEPNRDRPLLLAISSSADTPVGLLLPIEHGGSGILYKLAGSFKPKDALSCFEPIAADKNLPAHRTDDNHSQWSFWVQAAGHMDLVESHELKEFVHDQLPGPIMQCPNTAPGAFAMYSLRNSPGTSSTYPQRNSRVKADPAGPINRCYQVQPKSLDDPTKPRCNGTPYWIIPVDGNIIPDHGTIFTGRLVEFIGHFLPQPGETATLSSDQTRQAKGSAAQAPAAQSVSAP